MSVFFGHFATKRFTHLAVGFAVLRWRAALYFNEFADKVVRILIAYILCDLVDLLLGIDDLLGCFLDPIICQVVFETHPVFFPKDLA